MKKIAIVILIFYTTTNYSMNFMIWTGSKTFLGFVSLFSSIKNNSFLNEISSIIKNYTPITQKQAAENLQPIIYKSDAVTKEIELLKNNTTILEKKLIEVESNTQQLNSETTSIFKQFENQQRMHGQFTDGVIKKLDINANNTTTLKKNLEEYNVNITFRINEQLKVTHTLKIYTEKLFDEATELKNNITKHEKNMFTMATAISEIKIIIKSKKPLVNVKNNRPNWGKINSTFINPKKQEKENTLNNTCNTTYKNEVD